MAPSPHQLYNALTTLNHGIPLYTPEPSENLPAQYRLEGISIGDVGIVKNGSFEVLFNACQSVAHNINAEGIPANFEPFLLRPRDVSKRQYHSPGSVIASAKVTKFALNTEASSITNPFIPATVGVGVSLRINSKQCAILILPEGASREELLVTRSFHEHVKENADDWHEFARNRLHPESSLFVVTGCDKTSSWGIATVANASATIGATMNFTVAGLGKASLSPSYCWEDIGSATARVSASTFPRLQNQCIFIRGFRISRKPQWLSWPSLKGVQWRDPGYSTQKSSTVYPKTLTRAATNGSGFVEVNSHQGNRDGDGDPSEGFLLSKRTRVKKNSTDQPMIE